MTSPSTDPKPEWTLVIHGGAGVIEREKLTQEQDRSTRAALRQALDCGAAMLQAGARALDVVEAVVKALEDDPHFNAGRGAVLTLDGRIELDAAIMDGETRMAGAAAGLTSTRNPISLARAVMEQSPHVMVSGKGADRFSREHGLEQAGADWFVLPERPLQLEEMKSSGDSFDVAMKYGTVGAVALDVHGHVAAGTSTGGVMGKRWGRIGDSPLIGSGTYADDRACAVSCTGAGEYFIRIAAAHEISARMRLDVEDAQGAADAVIAELGEIGGSGGVILVSAKGEAVWSFNTAGMYRGRASGDAREVAIYGDE